MLASLTLGFIALASVVTFAVYGWDKSCARHDRNRVPERTLFALTLCGGGIGAWLARRVFHHKTQKHSFTIVIGVGVAIVAVLIVFVVV